MRPEVVPSSVLIDYIWGLLKFNVGMTEDHYDGLVPIVPVAEEPELTEYNRPYLVYGYVENPSRDLYKYRAGQMTFVIYSVNYREINKIMQTMQVAFERWDEAALDVNRYSSTRPEYHGIRFGSISIGHVEGGTPEANDQDAPTSEGGRQSGLVNIRYEYFSEVEVATSHTEWV